LGSLLCQKIKKKDNLGEADIVIGTTALLFVEDFGTNLVVIDEQQKFSREQREQMIMNGRRNPPEE